MQRVESNGLLEIGSWRFAGAFVMCAVDLDGINIVE
jgi:hypothetical protein